MKMVNDFQETKQKDSRAIPLQTIIVVMVVIGFIISFILMYFMYQTSKSYGEMRSSTENYIASQDIVANLLAGSDELTVYARGFVVTGDSEQGFNFPRLDTLMLAAPVKFEGRLIQYVGRLSRKYEGKKDVVVYDYVDSHIGFFDRQYKNRLRTYKKLGYQIISDPIKEKQIVNAIYDGTDYAETFERDMVEADKEIVISSPGLRRSKVDRMITLLKPRQESGVRVTVITLEPDSAGYDDTIELHIMIDEMKKSGINVRTTVDECEHYAVIDDRIVWHGGMNLLGKADVYDNLIRVESDQVAAELIEITEKQILSS